MNKIATNHSFRCNLNKGPLEVTLDKELMHQDALGDIFSVSVWRGGSPVELNGITVRGYLYLAATQQTVLLSGSASGSSASVPLTSSCYAVPGHAALVIQLLQGEVRHTVLKVNFVIDRTCTDTVIDPSNVLPTLPELLAQIAAMEQATAAAKTATADAQQATADTLAAAQELSAVTAPPIIPTATGKVVTVSDSAHRPLAGLRLYGKTTQDGTPTPDAPVELVNVGAGGSIGVKSQAGVNLIPYPYMDAAKTENGLTVSVTDGGGLSAKGTPTAQVRFTLVDGLTLPPGRYTLSGTDKATTGRVCIGIYDTDWNVVADINNYGRYTTTFDLAAQTTVKINIYFEAGYPSEWTWIRPQLEHGEVATAYAYYADGGSVTAATPGGLASAPYSGGEMLDYVDFGNGVNVHHVARVNLADLSWSRSEVPAGSGKYRFDNWDAPVALESATGRCNVFAVRIEPIGGNEVDNAVSCFTGGGVHVRYDAAETVDEFVAFLREKQAVYYYVRKDHIATPIPADELAAFRAMTSQKPTTTVYNDSGAVMQVDYIADTKLYIDNKLASISEALLNK